jgi:ubiquinol-cytochrome c reductase cytochrome b subunit
VIKRLVLAVDERVGAASWVRSALKHVFPDHWSFMLGEVALYSFTILVLTGVYLTLFFDSSLREVVYHGSYEPLQGTTMSGAYESVIRLSFDVRAGLVFRQIHHWAALVFLGAIVLHAGRIFFTGAFRKPRELNWLIGVTLLLLALANGFAGYSLLDDLLSGIGLRIAYSIGESIPLVGPWLVSLFFGGEFPGEVYLGRLYIIHVLVVPALIAALLTVHLAFVWRQKHTQFPGPGRTERNVVGSHLFPTYAARSIALFLGLFAVLAALGGLFQINPVWLWGPYAPAATTTAAQPDWYVGWLEGALRLFPPWEIRVAGFVVPNPFFPGVVMPGLLFTGMYAYPFLERRFTGDRHGHELLDRPRNRPGRTALGVVVLTYLVVLSVAGSQDVIAAGLGISVQAMVYGLRTAVIVAPLVTGTVAWFWCRALAQPAPEDRDDTEADGAGDGDGAAGGPGPLEDDDQRGDDASGDDASANPLVTGPARALGVAAVAAGVLRGRRSGDAD